DYRQLTHDLTLAVARQLLPGNPRMVFEYISGEGMYSGLTTAAVFTALLGAFVRTAPMKEQSPIPRGGFGTLFTGVQGQSHVCQCSALIDSVPVERSSSD